MSDETTILESIRRGPKTTEFWLTLLALAIGGVLIALGYDSIGGQILTVVVPGYAISRGVAKR